jgi:hypothetical protein
MRKTITAFGAGLMLIAAASLAAATPGLAQGSKTFAAQRAIGDPGIKLGAKNFRNPRAFNPQPDPPGKLRGSNPPQPDKRKTHRRR